MTIHVDGRKFYGHKFVLSARSDAWLPDGQPLESVSEFSLDGIAYDVAFALFKWVYTNVLELKPGEAFALALMSAANRYKLTELRERCEMALTPMVTEENCTSLLCEADKHGAQLLRKFCGSFIINCWSTVPRAQLDKLPAALFYELASQLTPYALHLAIKYGREDAVFIFLTEHGMELAKKINECDADGCVPLHLALVGRHESIAQMLVQHACDLNAVEAAGQGGNALLHKALARRDEFAAGFLIKHGAQLNLANALQQTPLHIAVLEQLPAIVDLLLQSDVNVNAQAVDGSTPLHLAVAKDSGTIVLQLVAVPSLQFDVPDRQSRTPLWLALMQRKEQLAKMFVQKGANVNATDNQKNTLLHRAVAAENLFAAVFLIEAGCDVTPKNTDGMAPLHLAAQAGLTKIVGQMIERGAAINAQNMRQQTPLHIAIEQKHVETINRLLVEPAIDLTIRDEHEHTALGLCLAGGLYSVAPRLVERGADVEARNGKQQTLLHQAIMRRDAEAVRFLLDHGCTADSRTAEGDVPLKLAIDCRLPAVVEMLCRKGVDINAVDTAGNPPIWNALTLKQDDIAVILVRYKCDINSVDADGDTLLHRAIKAADEASCIFLIGNGADVNAVNRRDGNRSAIHYAALQGLNSVVKLLLQRNAIVNARDAVGDTALHLAISNRQPDVVNTLLNAPGIDVFAANAKGMTPFAVALERRDAGVCYQIVQMAPRAGEQMDQRGYNFLHAAIDRDDKDCVEFLVNLGLNVELRTQDASNATALHLAVKRGNEAICGLLIDARADVNSIGVNQITAQHLACAMDYPAIVRLLLQHGADVNRRDRDGNTPLHVAVSKSHLNVVQVLLTEPNIDVNAKNSNEQTVLHALAFAPDAKSAAIFELLQQYGHSIDFNAQDTAGVTPLMMAFRAHSEPLCVAFVRAGAHVGLVDRAGHSIMDSENRCPQLLRLLGTTAHCSVRWPAWLTDLSPRAWHRGHPG